MRSMTNVLFKIKTAWARFGFLSSLLAKSRQYKGRPVLILSMPRSGSSWVSRVFGESPHVIYIREPITQSVTKYGITPSESVLKDGYDPPGAIKKYFDLTFAGIPAFSKNIAGRSDSNWSLASRPQKSLVIKEVNPFLCKYYLRKYNPKIIFILRHPAGIAASYQKMGWGDKSDLGWGGNSNSDQFWFDNSITQARAVSMATNVLGNSSDHKFVKYEDICERPVEMFKELFKFSNITWTDDVESFLTETMSSSESSEPYSIFKKTKEMSYSWKKKLNERQLNQIKKAYSEYDLPFYNSEQDWRLD